MGRIPQLIGDNDYLLSYELRLLDDFKGKAMPYLKHIPRTEWEWIFLAQHHGIPTRLLDWSRNPLIPLYFAVTSEPDEDFAIYQGFFLDLLYQGPGGKFLNKGGCVDEDIEENPFNLSQDFAIYPTYFDQRLLNQSALFTVHKMPDKAMTKDVTKYIFSSRLKPRFRVMLKAFGINKSFIYPTLDNIAKDIKLNWESQLPMPG